LRLKQLHDPEPNRSVPGHTSSEGRFHIKGRRAPAARRRGRLLQIQAYKFGGEAELLCGCFFARKKKLAKRKESEQFFGMKSAI